MNRRRSGCARHTIRFKLIWGVAAILVPLIALLNYNQYYAMQVVRKQVAESNQRYITMYMNQIDKLLEEADSFLIGMIVSEPNLQMLGSKLEEAEYAHLKVRLFKQLTSEITRNGAIDEFFVYTAFDGGLIESFSSRPLYDERIAVDKEVTRLLSMSPPQPHLVGRDWNIREIDGGYYMLRLLQADVGIYVGAWVKAETLLIPLKLNDLVENGFSLFSTEAGDPMMHASTVQANGIDLSFATGGYTLSGSPERYLTVGALSRQGNFRLVALIPEHSILEGLFNLREWNTVISIGSILLLPLSLLLLRRTIMLPLRRLLSAMKRIGEGHMQGIPEHHSSSIEFRDVNDNFNKMLSQISELKIHVYEERLRKQQAELRQLQMTINPHFYLNSLNILHSLAIVRDYELIQEMSRCLADYFRYIFRSNVSFVSLGEELVHMRNYVRIQELRFPGQLSSSIEVPSYLLELSVPPLVIQTFVENAIKHAFSLEQPFMLTIGGRLESDEHSLGVLIVIEDSGAGYSADVLGSLRQGASLEREDGSRHGIWNARRRLELLYGGTASVQFSNREAGGARVEIRLPLKQLSEGDWDNYAERADR